MQKLLLLSVVIATLVIPIVAAREKNAVRGVKKAFALMIVFDLCYMLALRYLYPHLQ